MRQPRRRLLFLLLTVCLFALSGCGSSTSFVVRANANIAFMGDSITAFWHLPTTNFGVGGNRTSQMLGRFQDEVLGHGFKTVVILGGTNDMRNVAFTSQAEAADAITNIAEMASQAASAKLTVVLCSIPPILNLPGRAEVLNAEIVKLANVNGYLYVDYFTPLDNHPEYFVDNLHPNVEGYEVMQTALAKVVSLSS